MFKFKQEVEVVDMEVLVEEEAEELTEPEL
jgi:hypothetical protein